MASNQHPYPYLAPYFKIYLGGKPLSDFEHSLVEEVIYEDSSTGSDMVSFTIHDPDYLIIGDKRIVKSTSCKVEGGWTNKYRTWIDGYVSAVDVDFPEEGFPAITVHVMDKTYLMNRLERKRVFKNVTYKDIASQIAKTYGFAFEGDTSGQGAKKHESVSQSFQTDIQFLIGLAEEIGYLVHYDTVKNKLYFKDKEKYTSKAPAFTFWYRRYPFDILSFRPRIVQADQVDEIEESDIDDKDKKPTKAKEENPKANNPKGENGDNPSGGSGSNSGDSSGGSSGSNMKYNPYTGKWEKV